MSLSRPKLNSRLEVNERRRKGITEKRQRRRRLCWRGIVCRVCLCTINLIYMNMVSNVLKWVICRPTYVHVYQDQHDILPTWTQNINYIIKLQFLVDMIYNVDMLSEYSPFVVYYCLMSTLYCYTKKIIWKDDKFYKIKGGRIYLFLYVYPIRWIICLLTIMYQYPNKCILYLLRIL